MPQERAAFRAKPIRRRRVPIGSQVLLAAGGLLGLLASSMGIAIGSIVAFWLVRSIAMPVSRLMAVLRVDVPSRGSA